MSDSTAPRAAAETAAGLGRLLRPRSVAIVGISDGPASMGYRALLSLKRFGYDGEIHLVNRNRREIDGRASVASIDELPMGVDAAIFSIPQAGVEETLKAAVARDIGGAVLFSAGYAEAGEEGRAAQDRLAQIARDGGLALAGPNCLGLVNYTANTPLTSGPVLPARDPSRPGLALLTQSGGMMGCLINASEARGLPLSYAISTGNEAVLGVIDYFEVVIEDDQCTGVAIFAEQLRDPARFLRLARRARALGKPVILLHSGKSARAQEAAVSHTGAVASNFNAMKASVEAEGVIVVDGMDALIDV
ncbi:MAG: CoA-binding protein, partial [Maritimibacter sp.]|nr:CoA-binding protein [Maritimibacter sp.]